MLVSCGVWSMAECLVQTSSIFNSNVLIAPIVFVCLGFKFRFFFVDVMLVSGFALAGLTVTRRSGKWEVV